MTQRLVQLFFAGCVFLFAACSGTKSAQQTMAEDRAYMYKEAYASYIAAENKYLNLLFNIERLPEEEELWIMKRDQMRELEQLRAIMLQTRGELDEALQDWEKYLSDLQKEVAAANAPSKARFRSQDDLRSSPGELLPGEFAKDSVRKAQTRMQR
ncbi:MAG: hypothetical protein J6Z31_01295 [Fibrobacter sp.]|nr:hypothetical protein [Fibrobacter sp.]